MRQYARRIRRGLPDGAPVVGAGLVVSGAATYGYLVITARALGPERYAGISVLWAATVLVALGFFVPVEQEVARALSARAASGVGGLSVVRRAAAVAIGFAIVLAAAAVVLAPTLRRQLFDGNTALVISFAVALVGYAGVHLLRGVLSGVGNFRGYGLVLAVEAVVRLAIVAALFGAGVDSAGPFGGALAVATFFAVVVVVATARPRLAEGPPAEWRELGASLGQLLAASLLAQVLVNGPPVAVRLLASAGEEAEAGRFLAGLVIARIPIFLFAAIQATLLPRLSAHAAVRAMDEFRALLLRILGVVAALSAAGIVGVLAGGAAVVRLLFGGEFDLRTIDLTLLAAASGAYLIALVLAQALIALGRQVRVTVGWAASVIVFAVCLLPEGDLITRVELAFLAGALAAAVALALLLATGMRSDVTPRGGVMGPPLVTDALEP